jgi:hypothetical protein
MTVAEAKMIAREWVETQIGKTPGLHGVIFGGSVNVMEETAPFSPSSDVDLFFIVDDKFLSECKQRKLVHQGVLLEPSYHPLSAFEKASQVLGNFLYASHLSVSSVVYDSDGELSKIQRNVANEYRRIKWVRARCDHIHQEVTENLIPELGRERPSVDRMLCLLLICNRVQNLPIVALLRPPTVRKALTLFREICVSYDATDLYQSYIDLIGCSGMHKVDALRVLQSCTEAYDYAVSIYKTPFFPDWELSEESRPMMIGGAEEFIEKGHCYEGILWLSLAWTAAAIAIRNDALVQARRTYLPAYETFLDRLDLGTQDGHSRKVAQARIVLSRAMQLSLHIMENNQDILWDN